MDGASEFVRFREAVHRGPFYCGDSTKPGKVVRIKNSVYTDNLKRYTDRYLTERQIGNTVKTYPYFTDMLSDPIKSFIGAKSSSKSSANAKSSSGNGTARIDQALIEGEAGEDVEIERDEEEEVEQVEDEFEEFDDDDYNAEKYFDDGGEDGDIDDAEEPDYS